MRQRLPAALLAIFIAGAGVVTTGSSQAQSGPSGHSAQLPGADHCHILLGAPYKVLQPDRIVASAQLSCPDDTVINELRLSLWRLDRKHRRWHLVARGKRSGRGTVLEFPAYRRCARAQKASYYEAGARGQVNGKPLWGRDRVRLTKVKLVC